MYSVFLLIVLIVTTNLWAKDDNVGSDKGNGGISVVCRRPDGSIINAELLDIFEGRELYKRTYNQDIRSVDEMIKIAENNLPNRPHVIYSFRTEIEKINLNRVFIEKELELELTSDALPVIKKKGCQFEQVANYTSSGDVLISKEIFEAFDSLNKAALYVHESLYVIYRNFNKNFKSINSRDSRKLTAHLMSFNVDAGVILVLVDQHFKPVPPNLNSIKPCGLSGEIDVRIKDCSKSTGNFVLVTRTEKSKEVFKDIRSGLIWSDTSPTSMDHDSAIEFCKKQMDEMGGIEAEWRLPTKLEFEEARTSHIISSLPRMTHYMFWVSQSNDCKGFNSEWSFNARSSGEIRCYPSSSHEFYDPRARCVFQ